MTSISMPMSALPMTTMAHGVQPSPVYITSLSQLPATAVPISQQMLAQALGQTPGGAALVQPESTSVLKTMLTAAGMGGLVGAAAGAIPFLPLGIVSGALVGAGVGAAVGLVQGLRRRAAEREYQTMLQTQAGQQLQPGTLGATPVPHTVHMGPAMRRRWAAKVAAERAAVAAKRPH